MQSLSKTFLGLSILAFMVILGPLLVFPVQAQDSVGTLTPTPTLTATAPASEPAVATPTPTPVQFANTDVVTIAQLRKFTGDIVLNGPYEVASFGFALPADWKLKSSGRLELLFGISFNTDVESSPDLIIAGGGTLTVFLNGVLLETLPLREVGESEAQIDIPLEAFEAVDDDDIHMLTFVLESSESCRFYGQNTTVYLHQTSFLNLPHDIVSPATSLVNFPRPIIQDSFTPDSALIIIPDQPSAAELQAALITAASMGKFSNNEMILDMATVSDLGRGSGKAGHLILVGKAASLPVLSELRLPLPVVNGQIQFSGDASENGLIGMIQSPWSKSHVVLVISANSDRGVTKAAQALSTGVIRPGAAENIAVVEQVDLSSTSAVSSTAVDRTLADLGYGNRTLDKRGFNAGYYDFDIPVGLNVGAESYFELVFGHSALIDYNSSQIVVLLNNQPIGSVRMSDATAKLPTNKIKVMIPPSVVKSGRNYLVVQAYLTPLDECAPPDTQGLWVNIWSESTLHLPLVTAPASPFAIKKLADFPDPFNSSPLMDNTAFILERDAIESWQNAIRVAAFLGDQSGGSGIAFSTFYGDEVSSDDRSKYNLIVVGKPSNIPIMSEVNDYLPAPFLSGGDIASEGDNFQVTYQIPLDSPLGYLEIIQSPWNSNNVILTILGNTSQGVNWAALALTDERRWRLTGNLAVINGAQILTADTLYSVSSTGEIESIEIPVLYTPSSKNEVQTPVSQPQWIPPAFVVLAIFLFLVLVIVAIKNRMSDRSRQH
jgi:hypothetical protein